jgi:hypothetical protein
MCLGATTGPLDGRALTHGVDARAGEGAGSSAAALHRATMSGSSLVHAGFFWCFGGGVGLWRRKEGACCWFFGRAAPLTAAGEAAGRGEEAGRCRRSCAKLRVGEEKMKGF